EMIRFRIGYPPQSINPSFNPNEPMNRRAFLKTTGVAAAALSHQGCFAIGSSEMRGEDTKTSKAPWYRRVTRWGQTNITEIDPTQYDIGWWRQHWKRTQTD